MIAVVHVLEAREVARPGRCLRMAKTKAVLVDQQKQKQQ